MLTALQFSIVFTQLSFFAALVAKPSPYRRFFIVPVILGETLFFQFALKEHSYVDCAWGCYILALLFVSSDYILLTDVQHELTVKGQKKPAFTLSLFSRIRWASSLFLNPRCVGWSHEPTYALPPRPPPSVTRSKFIFQELGKLARDAVLFEISTTYSMKTDYFSINGRSMAADGLFWRVVNVLVHANNGMMSLSMLHHVLGILSVLLGLVQPQDWPPLFGSYRHAYTLQGFWGRSWHQALRRMCASHGRFVAYDVLRLRKGTKASLYAQIYVAFAISAIIHAGGDRSLLGNWSKGGAFRFFLLQAVGITVETTAVDIAKWLNIRGSWRVVGYVWVVLWFTYTVPIWMDPLHRGGITSTTSNFGILDGILERIRS